MKTIPVLVLNDCSYICRGSLFRSLGRLKSFMGSVYHGHQHTLEFKSATTKQNKFWKEINLDVTK